MRIQVRLLAALVLVSCRPATQVTFDITTDVPCDALKGTSITIGLEGETERADPVAVTTNCRPDGTVGAIGSYAVAPRQLGVKTTASAKVAAAVGDGVDVEADCKFTEKYANCVVARRRISFVATRSLVVPIQLYLACKDVRCDENSTCNKAGKCVTSEVDSAKCDANGVCESLKIAPDSGVPCFNGKGVDDLYCVGDNAWCNLSMSGARSCSATPGSNGVSFQCRDSNDCGPNLICVAGADGVLGRCTTAVKPGDTTLCTIGEPDSPCEGGARQCYRDAGYGLTTCEPVIHPPAGALHCPRTASLQCWGATPYCSQFQEDPKCVADGGAQCWYNSDCPTGQRCFAGVGGQFSNLCTAAPTATNTVPLCDPTRGDADCPNGMYCAGTFYGNTACVKKCWPGLDDSECYGTGRDGVLTVPDNTFRQINAYAAIAPVNAGATDVVGATAALDAGTLVLLWQTAGMPPQASVANSTPMTLSPGGVGIFEAARVATVVNGNRFTVTKPLRNTYTAGAQLVTVPEYTSVSIGLDGGVGFLGGFRGGSFNGSTGGIVTFLAQGAVQNEGQITMVASGFAGGNNSPSVIATGCIQLDGDSAMGGGTNKGQGLSALTPMQAAGGFGRVTIGGGGGNCQNAGGGGGGHGGAGGRGGKSEDGQMDVGGWGGAPVLYDETILVMGGGAGAGQPHRNGSSAGGPGGGVVLVAAQSFAGNGTIDVRGSSPTVVPDGADRWGTYVDGVGGGGAGGLIDLRSQTTLACGGVTARGGRGLGNSNASGGGGGSGGGGVVRLFAGGHAFTPAMCPADVRAGVALSNGGTNRALDGNPGTDGRLEIR